jgi:hypothetical protein
MMTRSLSRLRRRLIGSTSAGAALVLLLLVSPPRAAAQDLDPDGPLPPIVPTRQADSAEAELRRLFVEVERSLRRIDDMLFEAAAGDAPLDGEFDSGLAELIDQTLSQSREAVSGMDRILEVAEELSRQQQQQQGQGQGQDGSGSRPNQQRPDGEGQRGDAPRREQEGGREQPAPELDPGAQPEPEPGADPSGGRPDQPGDAGQPPHQQRGQLGDDAAGEPNRPPPASDPWGDLPPRVQEVFRSQASDDMPPAYRDWIEAYHRRLSRR